MDTPERSAAHPGFDDARDPGANDLWLRRRGVRSDRPLDRIQQGLQRLDQDLPAGGGAEFTGTLEEARRTAFERLVEHARDLGSDAVVGASVRPDRHGEQQGMAEIVAYSSAVTLGD